LKSGDVILEFNGKKVTDSPALETGSRPRQSREDVPVKVLRNGATKNITVAVKEMPGTEEVAQNAAAEITRTTVP